MCPSLAKRDICPLDIPEESLKACLMCADVLPHRLLTILEGECIKRF